MEIQKFTMKASHIVSGLFSISCVIIFFASSNVCSENISDDTPAEQTISTPSLVSGESNHPLAMAHQQLKQAHENYNKGDIKAVQQNLAASSKWLQDPEISRDTKTKNEVAELVNDIHQLQEKINHPSDQHESTITQLWHRSSALVGREIKQLTNSWSETSTTNKTMSKLLDARLHFIYAEHELFNSHNADKTNKEINKTIAYLDEAEKITTPQSREKIAALKKDIQMLPDKYANKTEEHTIIHALGAARTSLEKARHSKSPEIQTRVKTIMAEIENLRKDVAILEKRQQYDTILKRLGQMDELLSEN